MRVFKNIKDLEVYKFGVISPVLHDSAICQNKYFRQLAVKGIEIPPNSGNKYYLKVATFKSWLRNYKLYGLEGLAQKPRNDKGKSQKMTPTIRESIDKVLKDEKVVSIKDLYRKLIRKNYIKSWQLSYETLRVYVRENQLLESRDLTERKKFEKEFVNELWMVDFKQGKSIRCGKRLRRTYLCAIIDDASRMLVGYEWGHNEDTALFARTFKKAISIYGIPKILYSDQGKVFLSKYIVQLCGRLGIALAHSKPYQPASRGKIERFNSTVSQMFYPLIKDFAALDIEQLNLKFSKFIDEIYHQESHHGLGTSPLKKYRDNLSKTTIRRVSQDQLEQFFLCVMKRTVRNDATIVIKNTFYEIDMKYRGEAIDIGFCIDQPERFYLMENDKIIREIKPVNLIENANRPMMSDSFSRLLAGNSEK
jgi:transposase InsO family protein